MARRHAAPLAAAAGALLVLAGVSGGSLLLQVGDALARSFLPPDLAAPLHLLFAVLLFVAGLGGLAVLGGAYAYRRRWWRAGHVLVDLGAGLGALGLAVLALLSLATQRADQFAQWLVGPAGIGVVLSILARRNAG
jgi:hypothetical protein